MCTDASTVRFSWWMKHRQKHNISSDTSQLLTMVSSFHHCDITDAIMSSHGWILAGSFMGRFNCCLKPGFKGALHSPCHPAVSSTTMKPPGNSWPLWQWTRNQNVVGVTSKCLHSWRGPELSLYFLFAWWCGLLCITHHCYATSEKTVCSLLSWSAFSVSALTLLVGWQEGHLACKKLSGRVLV